MIKLDCQLSEKSARNFHAPLQRRSENSRLALTQISLVNGSSLELH